MEIREMANTLEKKLANKIENASYSMNNTNSIKYKNINNLISSSHFSKSMNGSTEEIYNTSINNSINNGTYKLMNDLRNVIILNFLFLDNE